MQMKPGAMRYLELVESWAGRITAWAKPCPFKTAALSLALFVLVQMTGSSALAQETGSNANRTASNSGGHYRIAGTVVNAVSGEPLHHAMIAALSEEDSHTVAAVVSDNDGHFSLERLPAAKYQLTASKRGFRNAFYDEHGDYNSAIVTGPGQETGHLTFKLVPGGVVYGVVSTEGGDPVENARVMLFRKFKNGKPGGLTAQSDTTATDDTGAYEFDDLAAGDYYLAVSADPWYAMHRNSRRDRHNAAETGGADPVAALDVAYPVTFFDSATDEAAATRIQVSGGSRQQADVNLHAVPALKIEVETPRKPDGSIARAELRQTVFGTMIGAESSSLVDPTMQSGTAEFDGLAPGHYELSQGDPPRISELDASASQQVDPTVGMPTVTVRGTLRNGSGGSLAGECNVTLEAVDAAQHQSPVQAICLGGTFSFNSVPPGRWGISAESGGVQLPVASVAIGGRTHAGNVISVQDRPLTAVVSVSEGTTRLEGFAKRDGKGAAGVMVELVPKDLSAMDGLVRRDQSDSDGSFSLRDVVPGQYTVLAIQDGWDLDWADPHTIARYLPGGVAVTVSDKAGKVVSLPAAVPVQSR